jgi:predicted AAA+ superfamily ATPase
MAMPLDLLPRLAAQALASALRIMPVVVITGARQTGKTTLARQLTETSLTTEDGSVLTTGDGQALGLDTGKGTPLYVSLDVMANARLARSDPNAFVHRADRLIIDEVQREPELLLAIKRAVDEDPVRQPGRFILTGSANLSLRTGVKESLAGRASYVDLQPLTRREQLAFGSSGIWSELLVTSADQWRELVEAQTAPDEPWADLARRGGYPTPAYQYTDDEDRRIWFDGYLRTYLERDIAEIAAIDNLPGFDTIVRSMALRTGTIVNQTQVARDASMPQTTVQRYISNLEASFLLHRLPAYVASRTKQLVKSPRFYWVDAGLALFLGREREPRGEHFETLVASDLLAWRGAQFNAPNVFYWRTTKGAEVDFVIDDGSRLLPVEVKTTSQPSSGDMAGLRAFMDEYGDRAPSGLLLHTGTETFWIAKGVLAVPWWRIL